jgi:AraC-like DNA-binding protein
LEPGELLVSTTADEWDGVCVGAATINRTSLHRYRSPADFVTVLLRSRDSASIFVDGRELTQCAWVRVGPHEEVELIAHRGSTLLLVSLQAGLQSADGVPLWLNGSAAQPARAVVDCSWDTGIMLEDSIRATLRRLDLQEGASAAERARRIAVALLCRSDEEASYPRSLRPLTLEHARQHAAVELARRYIREHLAERIRLADLCACTHLRSRWLEYGFQELVRISPMRYVKMLRLDLVRRQFLADAARQRSISQIALDAGFTHLSQFAAEYKKVFTESPSATRRRIAVQLELGPMARRRPSSTLSPYMSAHEAVS